MWIFGLSLDLKTFKGKFFPIFSEPCRGLIFLMVNFCNSLIVQEVKENKTFRKITGYDKPQSSGSFDFVAKNDSIYLFYDRPTRPVSLNLEQIAADNSSEATGRTSGYSTSNDSDLGESRELDFDLEDEMPLSRETQVHTLEP